MEYDLQLSSTPTLSVRRGGGKGRVLHPGVPRVTRLDPFESAVDAFVREGGRTATVLHRRLQDQGCRSTYCTVLRFLGRRLHAAGVAPAGSSRGPPRPRRPPARALSFEFVAALRIITTARVEKLRDFTAARVSEHLTSHPASAATRTKHRIYLAGFCSFLFAGDRIPLQPHRPSGTPPGGGRRNRNPEPAATTLWTSYVG